MLTVNKNKRKKYIIQKIINLLGNIKIIEMKHINNQSSRAKI